MVNPAPKLERPHVYFLKYLKLRVHFSKVSIFIVGLIYLIVCTGSSWPCDCFGLPEPFLEPLRGIPGTHCLSLSLSGA